jgi:hypothetical protein
MLKKLPAGGAVDDPTPVDHSPALLIREKLLRALGEPAGLLRVQVRSLWHHFYRANVFVGDAASSRVAHSYFLTATKDGDIVTSSPPIRREY